MTTTRTTLLVRIGTKHIKFVEAPDGSCFDIYVDEFWKGSRRTMKQALEEAKGYAKETERY